MATNFNVCYNEQGVCVCVYLSVCLCVCVHICVCMCLCACMFVNNVCVYTSCVCCMGYVALLVIRTENCPLIHFPFYSMTFPMINLSGQTNS